MWELTTKEKILDVSMELFAQKGFKDVSVREIAKTVGIKASSLYKHYESKEDILEQIFLLFKEKMARSIFSKEELRGKMPVLSPESYLKTSFEYFKRIMWDPKMVKIARIITMEQRRNQSVREFFMRELIEKPNEALRYAFDLMLENGLIDPVDTRVLAQEYNAYIVYLYFEQNFLKESLSFDEIERKMDQHNDFYARHILARREGSEK
ncbi:MAG: TetR/AcrR family transcriptional regulator [Christensenellales bacterium]